jgi:hypothetical protein
VIRMIFSRTWNLREKGIDQIEEKYQQNIADESEGFVASVAVVRHTIGDKIIGVCTRSILFLTNICRSSDPSLNGHQLKEIQSHT